MSVINTSTKTPVTIAIAQFHRDLATCAMHGVRTAETVAKKTESLIIGKYGDKLPEFKDYKADMAALKEVAKQRKLADAQWVLRPYWAALKKLYGSLPVSMAPEAVQKRAQREAADKLYAETLAKAKAEQTMQAVSNPEGAPKGETQERQPSEAEQLEQLIARVGVFDALYACLRILDSDESTKAQVVHMRKMADKAKEASAKADAAARLKAITPQAS